MNIANVVKTGGKVLSGAAGAAADAVGTGLGSLDGYVGKTVSEAAGSKIYSKASNVLMDESVQGARRKVAQSLVNSNNSFRLGNAVGGGAEGLFIGASSGAVIGGIAGGVNEDETFLGGAAKGALIGGAGGAVGGAISGYAHNNAGLVMNASNDAFSIAERLCKWGVGMKDSVSTAINNSPVGEMVRPGSVVTDMNGVKIGTQIDGQMRIIP